MLAVKEKASSSVWAFPTRTSRIERLSQGTRLTSGEFRDERPRWSPDGRAFVFESLSEGSFDLWVADADGKAPRRVTSLPGNERSAAWQASPLHLYFRDDRGRWRMPMADPFTPAGPPVRWLAIPGLRVLADSIDVSRDSARLVVSLARPESDIWLVERR